MAIRLSGPTARRYTAPHCVQCGGPTHRGRDLCRACVNRLVQRAGGRDGDPPTALATATRLG